MNEPKVSVIVATYRRDNSLQNALESILKQTYKNIEIILVDDNDEDAFNKTVKKIADEVNSMNPNISIKVVYTI